MAFCFYFAIRRRRRFYFVRHHYCKHISTARFFSVAKAPDTRLSEVREVCKRTKFLLDFRAYVRAYIALFSPPGALPGGSPQNAGPQIDALV